VKFIKDSAPTNHVTMSQLIYRLEHARLNYR